MQKPTEPEPEQASLDLYDTLEALGVVVGSHRSDLYVRDCPIARKVLQDNAVAYSRFTSAIDGAPLLDVPFYYAPFWRARTGR